MWSLKDFGFASVVGWLVYTTYLTWIILDGIDMSIKCHSASCLNRKSILIWLFDAFEIEL